MTVDYRLSLQPGGGTQLDYACHGEMPGVWKLIAIAMRPLAKWQLRRFFRTLRRLAEAEVAIREVISVGLLLMDESPALVGHMVGATIANYGGKALERVFMLSGQYAQADQLWSSVGAAERAVTVMSVGRGALGTEAYFESLTSLASDPEAQRALRWESLEFVSAVTPCMNLQRVVFGPGEDYAAWLQAVRSSLVRFPSEQAFYDVAIRGMAATDEPSLIARLLAVTAGGKDQNGSCSEMLNRIHLFM